MSASEKEVYNFTKSVLNGISLAIELEQKQTIKTMSKGMIEKMNLTITFSRAAKLFGSLVSFIFVGNVALAVQTVMRSFNINRMRGLWIAGFILIFTGALFFTGRIEAMAGRAFSVYCPVTVYGIEYSAQIASYPSMVVNIPIVSTLISLGVGIACFFASAWLLKRKVEV